MHELSSKYFMNSGIIDSKNIYEWNIFFLIPIKTISKLYYAF